MSVRQSYTLKDFQSYLESLPAALSVAAVRGIQAGVARGVGIAQRGGDKAAPASERGKVGAFDTGNYRRRWRAVMLPDGGAVTNDATYADVIRRGRRPGRRPPPRVAIVRWAMRKLGLSEVEAKRAAYPIARAIARRGLRARDVPDAVEPQIIAAVLAEMKRAIGDALRGGH